MAPIPLETVCPQCFHWTWSSCFPGAEYAAVCETWNAELESELRLYDYSGNAREAYRGSTGRPEASLHKASYKIITSVRDLNYRQTSARGSRTRWSEGFLGWWQ